MSEQQDESKKRPAMHHVAKAFAQGACRPRSEERPHIEETIHVSNGLNTLFYGSVNDPGALFWIDL